MSTFISSLSNKIPTCITTAYNRGAGMVSSTCTSLISKVSMIASKFLDLIKSLFSSSFAGLKKLGSRAISLISTSLNFSRFWKCTSKNLAEAK